MLTGEVRHFCLIVKTSLLSAEKKHSASCRANRLIARMYICTAVAEDGFIFFATAEFYPPSLFFFLFNLRTTEELCVLARTGRSCFKVAQTGPTFNPAKT